MAGGIILIVEIDAFQCAAAVLDSTAMSMRGRTLCGVALNDVHGDHGTRDALDDHGTRDALANYGMNGGYGTRARKTLHYGKPLSQKRDVHKKDESILIGSLKTRSSSATTTPFDVSHEKQPPTLRGQLL